MRAPDTRTVSKIMLIDDLTALATTQAEPLIHWECPEEEEEEPCTRLTWFDSTDWGDQTDFEMREHRQDYYAAIGL